MIELYTAGTPNGRKIPIMLEEIGAPYTVHPINLGKNEQFEPSFLAISPNNKIPAIVDTEGPVTIFESGAILIYLAEKTGKLLASSGAARYLALQWLNWQVGGFGPMLGQLAFFAMRSEEKDPFAIKRFTEECERLLGVMDKRLGEAEYLAGADYSIADVSCYAWALGAGTYLKPVLGDKIATLSHFNRWLALVGERPAVQRGMKIP